ncbi:hypothetical protein OBBRIDRAFT_542785 [Obba rivulosa]|uniref:Uncharacterized protein n=1 Tax=Obba rivulosa TaxID=1052685 RepID=A0A8E2AZY8_9APHY|nr:hypothetical protein OBBRIDRAFT_542785 [Obba rivulosa]
MSSEGGGFARRAHLIDRCGGMGVALVSAGRHCPLHLRLSPPHAAGLSCLRCLDSLSHQRRRQQSGYWTKRFSWKPQLFTRSALAVLCMSTGEAGGSSSPSHRECTTSDAPCNALELYAAYIRFTPLTSQAAPTAPTPAQYGVFVPIDLRMRHET